MEILKPEQYPEYEAFVENHPGGGITQSTLWWGVKDHWGHRVVVSRDGTGAIVGGVSLLVRRVPYLGTALLYSPRGPVCDYHDAAVLRDLKSGVDALAREYKAYSWKLDPDIPDSDVGFAAIAREMGMRQFKGGDGFETIQARFNYRLYFDGRTEEELFANLTQMTRRNVRKAIKRGVEVRPVGEEYLDDFMRLMEITGERDGFTVRSRVYFEKMLRSLGDHCRLYMAFYETRPISGAITTNYAGKTCYIYGASDNVHRDAMPNYLLQWEMIKWALETGCTVYDFQGVSGNTEDETHHLYGLYRFKRGFNGTLDELCGEYDYYYRPVMAKLVDWAISFSEWLRAVRRRLSR